MKKYFLFVLSLIVLISLFACGSDSGADAPESSDISSETQEPEETKYVHDPADGRLLVSPQSYYKCVVYKLPDDFRQAAVDHMRKQSEIEWVCSANFKVDEEFKAWGIDLQFVKGIKYTGIPYADTKVSYDQFMDVLVDGTYTNSSTQWKTVHGVQCVSSIMNSIQQFCPDVAGTSNVLMPSYSTFEAKICGEYTVPRGVNQTVKIIQANSPETMYLAYSKLQKGDIICTKDDTKGTSHFRMLVEDPTVVYDANGNIDPNKSSVKTIEQTNAFDKWRDDKVRTTWYVDHKYLFGALRISNYIPLTLPIYEKAKTECQVPYLYLDNKISANGLGKGNLNGTVASNFPIRFVRFEIFDSNGDSVKVHYVQDMAATNRIQLKDHSQAVLGDLASGKYTLVLKAGIAIGSDEFCRVDFTKA